MEWLTNIFSIFTTRSIGRTSWGRWVGSILVFVIVGVWAFLSIKNNSFITIDNTNTVIVVFILIMNGLKLSDVGK